MRYLFCLLLSVCMLPVMAQEIRQLYKGKHTLGAKIVEPRDTTGINPFTIAKRVELLTYANRMRWWPKLYSDGKDLLEDGALTIPPDSIRSRTILDTEQTAELDEAFYQRHLCEESMVAGCYEPRHLLVFYSADDVIIGCIEVCLTCPGGYVSEGLRPVVFCLARMQYLGIHLRF